MHKIIIRDEFGNEQEVCEAPQEFVRMVLSHKNKQKIEIKGCGRWSEEDKKGYVYQCGLGSYRCGECKEATRK